MLSTENLPALKQQQIIEESINNDRISNYSQSSSSELSFSLLSKPSVITTPQASKINLPNQNSKVLLYEPNVYPNFVNDDSKSDPYFFIVNNFDLKSSHQPYLPNAESFQPISLPTLNTAINQVTHNQYRYQDHTPTSLTSVSPANSLLSYAFSMWRMQGDSSESFNTPENSTSILQMPMPLTNNSNNLVRI